MGSRAQPTTCLVGLVFSSTPGGHEAERGRKRKCKADARCTRSPRTFNSRWELEDCCTSAEASAATETTGQSSPQSRAGQNVARNYIYFAANITFND